MNETALTTRTNGLQFDEETVKLIKSAIMPATSTDKELQLFLYQAKRTGLDPLTRQIYCIKTKSKSGDKFSIQSTIDGFRLVAERSGEYEGQTPAYWCGEDGVWKDVWLDTKKHPEAAKIGVYRKGFKEPLYAVARWNSYVQQSYQDGNLKVNFTWNKMGDLMLAKCAEALALRKAFPQELSGLYTNEEMGSNLTEEPEHNKEPDKPAREKAYEKELKKTPDEIASEIKKETGMTLNEVPAQNDPLVFRQGEIIDGLISIKECSEFIKHTQGDEKFTADQKVKIIDRVNKHMKVLQERRKK